MIFVLIMHLAESQRIRVLMMIGYGNRTRKESEMCDLFNVKYPDHHIIQATVNKIKWKFRTVGHVSDKYKGRNSKIPKDKKFSFAQKKHDCPLMTKSIFLL
ncbi:hypothetical protein ABEB36_011341 [Hypothenemus hampei]|uniref:Uncharacterized protein n=1 Tax=Hypothenemus hampei TaxID=57062 RepID=A0ABD1EF53_HYPHA